MTSEPFATRSPTTRHPAELGVRLIDYQPEQLATVRSMDHDLVVKNAVSTVRAAKAFGVPVVHSTVNVSSGQSGRRCPSSPSSRR